jgi:hypothetical protein
MRKPIELMKLMDTHTMTAVLATSLALMMTTSGLRADTFGSGANTFTIDFVTVGNAGNADDAGAGGGSYSSPFGGVAYNYRIGTYEIAQDAITKATNLGMANVTAGASTGSQPATNMTWYEAAAFVNWLNTSTGHQAAYNLAWNGSSWSMGLWSSGDAWQLGGENPYRHKNALYFLPSEDEWYKAAYHKNDGVTANYWDYPTASNSVPDGIDFNGDPTYQAVFDDGYDQGQSNAVINAGSSASAYGTYGQGGNVSEWNESAYYSFDGPTDNYRTIRGGDCFYTEYPLRSSVRDFSLASGGAGIGIGFRVASVPEPSAVLLMVSGVGAMLFKSRRKSSL